MAIIISSLQIFETQPHLIKYLSSLSNTHTHTHTHTHTMLEESVSSSLSIWGAMNSWLTPTVLFVLMNIMIGTILFNSNLLVTTKEKQEDHHHHDASSNNQHHQNDPHNPKLTRSPSVLKRLKSINFRNFRSQEAAEQTLEYEFQQTQNTNTFEYVTNQTQFNSSQTQSVITHTHQEKTMSANTHEPKIEDEEEAESLEEVYSNLGGHKVTDGDFIRTTSETMPASGQVPAKLPTKMKKSASMKSSFAHFHESDIVEIRRPATVRESRTEPDEEVDAKADDFINKFKNQLKLQRMNSILRYKDVISRGSAK